MAETQAITGDGTTFEVETAPGSNIKFKLGELTGVTPPSSQKADVDATHLESPDQTEENIPGLKSFNEMPITLNWIPGNPTDEFILDWEADGTRRRCWMTYPNGVVDAFPAYVKGYSGENIVPGGKMGATMTLKPAGAKARE